MHKLSKANILLVALVQCLFLLGAVLFWLRISVADSGPEVVTFEPAAISELAPLIGQLIVTSLSTTYLDAASTQTLQQYHPGGILLFAANIINTAQVRQLALDLQEMAIRETNIPLLVAVDQEGGAVRRITDTVTQFPGNMAAGVINNPQLVYLWGRITGLELRGLGINMNMAPVLDINTNPKNPVINIRSFGSDPALVGSLCAAYISGLQESQCISVGKHFPGHGDTAEDSHLLLPSILKDLEQIKAIEILPFRKAVAVDIQGIMLAHLVFPEIDASLKPASLSRIIVTDILRDYLGFQGLVITDDLQMEAIKRNLDLGEAAVLAIEAGSDLILVSNTDGNLEAVYTALASAVQTGRISQERLMTSVNRILKAKHQFKILQIYQALAAGKTSFNEAERELLKKAPELNQRLSRESLFYAGNRSWLRPDPERARIFITSSPVLTRYLPAAPNAYLFANFNEYMTAYFSRLKTHPSVLFWHYDGGDWQVYDFIDAFCRKNNIPLVVLVSGNPYPIFEHRKGNGVLCSFSATAESLRQLAACLSGRFAPRYEIPIPYFMER